MWDDTTAAPAPAPASSGSIVSDALNGLFGLASKKLDADAQRATAQATFNQKPGLGVNQDGVPFLAGKASFAANTIAGVPAPLVLVGVGILALAFILHGRG